MPLQWHKQIWQSLRNVTESDARSVGSSLSCHSTPTEPLGKTPSTAFRHLPPNSARIGYATEWALFISAKLSTDVVSALQQVRVQIRLRKQHSVGPSLINLMVSVDVKHHVYLTQRNEPVWPSGRPLGW